MRFQIVNLTVRPRFPYTDTLKILEKWGEGCHFFGNGMDRDINELERLLEREIATASTPVLSLFAEFPSNPLLRSPDLLRLRALADKYHFLIVIDDTIGNFVNVEVLPYADIVVSSLSKIFSGDANVMGGRLVHQLSPLSQTLRCPQLGGQSPWPSICQASRPHARQLRGLLL